MQQKRLYYLLLLLLIPGVLFAQSGKLRGTVIDQKTKEPLIGANVTIEGTNLGSATDVDGTFLILNVAVGTYTLKTSYVGYHTVTISNIRVNSEMTTQANFELSSEDVQVQAVEIVAERPLIQRNTTNTVRISTQDEIQNLPVRGIQNIVALQAGVVTQAGNLYVRGGRSGEVAYYIDGAPATNPLTNTNNITVVQEGIEEIQLQAGGYTAELGGSNSGIVKTQLRTGGSEYKGSLLYETDDFAKPGEKFLGTTNQGYRNIVATVSGPVPMVKDMRFFVLYQNDYRRNRTYMWLTPFDFNLMSDTYDPRGADKPLPYDVKFLENYLPHNWYDSHTAQGTLVYDLKPLKFLVSGSYQFTSQPDNGGVGSDWPATLDQYFRLNRIRLIDRNYYFLSLRTTYSPDASTICELTGNYNGRFSDTYDPNFKNDWMKYTDSIANAQLGFVNFKDRWSGPEAYSAIYGFLFQNENAPNDNFNKQGQYAYGLALDVTRQMNRTWELKAGGRYDYWTMRNFTVNSIQGYMAYMNNPSTRLDTMNAQQIDAALGKAGSVNNYGYDVKGNLVTSGTNAPYHPEVASFYIQNKFEYKDIILNVGLRYEYFNAGGKVFRDAYLPDMIYDVIDKTKLVDAPTFDYLLPRISFSLPVTDNTVFYTQYGLYAQNPALNNLYIGNTALSRTVSQSTRGNAYLTPVGFNLRPERTTSYEMGIRQMLSDNFALTMSGFYKDMRDQLQVRNLVDAQGVSVYRAYQNVDFGTVKGLELTLELRRTHRFSARINYTLSDARGTGSNPNGAFGIIEQGIGRQINSINPLLYDQTHRGTVLLDYRWPINEGGKILSGLGGNILISFNSGHPYTKIKELNSLGQADPWSIGTYPQQDPRYSYPAEPINTSMTPFYLNVDLNVSKMFEIANVKCEVFVNVTNLLNTKHILNVYPTTGSAQNDGWLTNSLATGTYASQQYQDFYRAINLENRYAYLGLVDRGQVLVGSDIYGVPRQIRAGFRVEL
jgi:hypothetical protein